jgi:hypothetical protein
MRLAVTVFATLAVASLLHAKDPIWKTGKVMDSASARHYIQTGSTTNINASGTAVSTGSVTTADVNGTANSRVDNTAVVDTQLIIAGDEYVYTVNDSVQKAVGIPTHGIITRSIANRKHGCRYVIGDGIQYAQDKNALLVKDADGKECKLEILRQERVAQPAPQAKP